MFDGKGCKMCVCNQVCYSLPIREHLLKYSPMTFGRSNDSCARLVQPTFIDGDVIDGDVVENINFSHVRWLCHQPKQDMFGKWVKSTLDSYGRLKEVGKSYSLKIIMLKPIPHLIRPSTDLIQTLGFKEPFPQLLELLYDQPVKDEMKRINAHMKSSGNQTGQEL